jgi:hypothetical protein
MAHERFLDKSCTPTDQDILDTIGERSSLWLRINENYDFNKELAFFSKNYGWTVRYRKGKKTLVSCFPEKDAFSVLLVLGLAEAEKVNQIREELNENFLSVFDETELLHDGKWMWIRILNQEDLDSLTKVIQIKRKIKKR